MAITAGNAAYSGTGPTLTGQSLVQNLGGPDGQYFKGTATVTGDGASATFDVNFIDGTNVLPFTPSGMLCMRTGGAATASIFVNTVSGITATKFTVNTSANVNAATFIVSFIAWK
jgi:hypothetical protein